MLDALFFNVCSIHWSQQHHASNYWLVCCHGHLAHYRFRELVIPSFVFSFFYIHIKSENGMMPLSLRKYDPPICTCYVRVNVWVIIIEKITSRRDYVAT